MSEDPQLSQLPQESTAFAQFVRPLMVRRNLVVIFAFLLGTLCSGYFFFFHMQSRPPEHVPLIKADLTPFKIRPDNIEQPTIPHQDKLVYNRLTPGAQKAKIERLLPPPEEPIIFKGEKNLLPDNDNLLTQDDNSFSENNHTIIIKPATGEDLHPLKEEGFPLLKEIPAKAPIKTPVKAPVVKDTPVASAKPSPISSPTLVIVPTRKPKAPQTVQTKTQEKPKSKPATSNQLPVSPLPRAAVIIPRTPQSLYRIQLAAMRTPTLARQEWHRLLAISPDLNRLKPDFIRIDLGAKRGVFYRVQAGQFNNKEQASKVCKQLQKNGNKTSCMVVPYEKKA